MQHKQKLSLRTTLKKFLYFMTDRKSLGQGGLSRVTISRQVSNCHLIAQVLPPPSLPSLPQLSLHHQSHPHAKYLTGTLQLTLIIPGRLRSTWGGKQSKFRTSCSFLPNTSYADIKPD